MGWESWGSSLHVTLLLRQLGNAIEDAASTSKTHVASSHEAHDSIEPELAKYLMDDDESNELDLDSALADISHIVECLLRLSITIKNPAPHDQFMSKVELDMMTAYEPYYIRHIMEKFPLIERKLSERLGRALAHRRHFFKYREDHHARLASGIDDDGSLGQGGDQTTVASPVPGHLKDVAEEDPTINLDDRLVLSMTSYASSPKNSEELQAQGMSGNTFEKICGDVDISKAYGPCPMCIEVHITTAKQYCEHIGHHLEQLSLFALPPTGNDDDESESQEETIEVAAAQEWQAIESPIYHSSEDGDPSQVAVRTTDNSPESPLLGVDQKLGVFENSTERQGITADHLRSEMEKLNITNPPGPRLSPDLDSPGGAKNEVSGDVLTTSD
ncbi:hypothetical protein EKO27_g8038 [Xylaria grammica]|uniref:Uncharacterized protein n=1 Tax=Xylaria grammica TaxID=363999 RepID=A0A439CXX0_9PEZI|nr:hypothetical protein EKO27_g8038 [Xylaria grammica]